MLVSFNAEKTFRGEVLGIAHTECAADVSNRCKGGRVSDVRTYLKSEDELHPFLTNLWYKLNWGLGGLHDRSGLLQEYKTVTLLLISSCWWRWSNELVKLLCLVTGFTDMTTEVL